MTVKGNIQSVKHDLSTNEQKIATYLVAHPNEVLEMNVQELAHSAGTSAATVSRFVRRLKFSGYNELKLQLSADLTATEDPTGYQEINKNESLHAIKSKLLNNAERSIQETVDQIKPENVTAIIKLIHQSQKVMLFGVGASFLTAKNISQKWTRLGYACVASDDLNQILPLIVTANAKKNAGVLWVISNSGESPEVVLAAKLAKEAGVPVITTTKIGNNSLSRLGDINIQTSQPIESSARVAATQSLHAQFMLIDIVYYAFVSQYYDQSQASVKTSREAIQKYKQSMRDGF